MEWIRLAGRRDREQAAARAAAVLRAGGIALLPAEGVYGLHALAADASAVERLRALKPRAAGRGFIGLIARPEDLKTWAKAEARASSLARAHWPGALTLVLEASPAVPASLRTPEQTVALRCPGSVFLRAVVHPEIEAVALAAKKLTPAQQEVISLRFASELSVAEAAKVMGKSEGAVKALQHSAIVALRKTLGKGGAV